MATKISTICTYSFYATGLKLQTNIFKSNLIAFFQCHECLASLKCHRFTSRRYDANDIFVNRQTWIDITDRKYRTIGIPAIAKIKIATKCERLDQHGCFRVFFLPATPVGGNDTGLLQLQIFLRKWPRHRVAQKRIEHRICIDVVHHLIGPD